MNLSLKYILSDNLKHSQLPWWEEKVANGFPLIGEGQIGAFYLPNLLFFKLFSFPLAFNIGYVFSFLIAATGFFLYIRIFINSKIAALFGSLFFSFSAVLFLQITHYNALQSYCLIPLVFYFFEKYFQSKKKIAWFLFLVLICSQQFFIGHIMTSGITIFFMVIYFSFRFKTKSIKSLFTKTSKFFITFIIFFLLASLVQFLPSLEYAINSTRINGLGIQSLSFSLPISALATYVNFNFFGAPNKIAYNLNRFFSLGTNFWESNLYFGVIPIFLIAIGLFLYWRNKKIRLFIFFYFISLFLALGKNSPFYFLYLIPPFNFFRTPSRFIIFMNLFLLLIFSVILELFLREKRKLLINIKIKYFFQTVLFLILSFSFINLIIILYNYHPLVDFNKILKSQVADYLNENYKETFIKNSNKIYSQGNMIIWQSTIINEGWKSPEKYLFLENDLIPYYNAVFKISSANVFPGTFFYPKLEYKFQNLIKKELYDRIINEEKGNFPKLGDKNLFSTVYLTPRSIGSSFIKLIRLKNVRFFITPFNFKDSREIKKIYETKKIFNQQYYLRVYEIVNPYPRFYFSSRHEIDSTEDIFNDLVINKINIIEDKPMKISLEIESSQKAFLIATDSYYPGWNVYLDGKKIEICQVNINQRAILISTGKHILEFRYQPWWHPGALIISLLTYFLMIAYIAKSFILDDYKDNNNL